MHALARVIRVYRFVMVALRRPPTSAQPETVNVGVIFR